MKTGRKKYTKKQIEEAIKYWKKRLNEASEPSRPVVTGVSLADVLGQNYQYAVDVTYGAEGDSAVGFSDEAAQVIDTLVGSDKNNQVKRYYAGISTVMTREEYEAEESGSHGYDDYLEDCVYDEKRRFSVHAKNEIFAPAWTAAYEGCSCDGQPKTFIVSLYSFS